MRWKGRKGWYLRQQIVSLKGAVGYRVNARPARQFLANRERCRTVQLRAQPRLTSLPLHLSRSTSRLSDAAHRWLLRFRVCLLFTRFGVATRVSHSETDQILRTPVIPASLRRVTQHDTRFSFVVTTRRRSRNVRIGANVETVMFEVLTCVKCR